MCLTPSVVMEIMTAMITQMKRAAQFPFGVGVMTLSAITASASEKNGTVMGIWTAKMDLMKRCDWQGVICRGVFSHNHLRLGYPQNSLKYLGNGTSSSTIHIKY